MIMYYVTIAGETKEWNSMEYVLFDISTRGFAVDWTIECRGNIVAGA